MVRLVLERILRELIEAEVTAVIGAHQRTASRRSSVARLCAPPVTAEEPVRTPARRGGPRRRPYAATPPPSGRR